MEGEMGIGRFGWSLPVENVQALAAKGSKEIPERYIRPERKEDIVVAGVNGGDTRIPIIDFVRLFDPEFSEEEAAKLHSACEDWGFFQLINHGVPEEIINKMKQDIDEFFKLPLEQKEAVAQLPGQLEGYGQAFVHTEEQKLDWGDMLFLGTFPQHIQQLRFWPTNPPSCRETFDQYALQVKRVADHLIKIISKNFRHGPEKLYDLFKGGSQSLRFNYYPPCSSPNKVFGLSPHSDSSILTLLLQVNEMHGLQIRRNDKWLLVEALPGAFIINIGDVLEILCNGKYRSIEHRAVVNNEKERISIASFHSLNIGDVVGPISELAKGEKVLYKSFQFEEYSKQFYAGKLEGKSILDRMKLEG